MLCVELLEQDPRFLTDAVKAAFVDIRSPLAGQRLWGLDAPALEADPVALTDPTVRTATPAS